MIVLAVVPGPGIYVVISRTLTNGFGAGVVTTAGIVLGDFVFIFLVYFGFSALASEWADFFNTFILMGGIYLIILSYFMVQPVLKGKAEPVEDFAIENIYVSAESKAMIANFLSGLFVTLSNPKAILFYASFLPAFLDFNDLGIFDLCTILFCAAFAVGAVMLSYAYLADRTTHYLLSDKTSNIIQLVSAFLMAIAGLVVLWRYI